MRKEWPDGGSYVTQCNQLIAVWGIMGEEIGKYRNAKRDSVRGPRDR